LHEITPRPPFNISLHLDRFTLPGRPTPWLYDPDSRTLRALAPLSEWTPILARITGEPWEPRVLVSAPGPREGEAVEWAARLVRAELDWARFLALAKRVPWLSGLARKYLGVRPGRCSSLYAALVDAIPKQRVPLRVGLAVLARLVEALGVRARYGGRTHYWYPTPEALVEAGVEGLRSLRLPHLKARALLEVAQAEQEGRLPSAREAERDPEGVAGELTRLHGVGPWTANLAVAMVHPLFPLGPHTDLAVKRGLEALLGRKLTPGEARKVAGILGDYAGLAMYLAALEYEDRRALHRRINS